MAPVADRLRQGKPAPRRSGAVGAAASGEFAATTKQARQAGPSPRPPPPQTQSTPAALVPAARVGIGPCGSPATRGVGLRPGCESARGGRGIFPPTGATSAPAPPAPPRPWLPSWPNATNARKNAQRGNPGHASASSQGGRDIRGCAVCKKRPTTPLYARERPRLARAPRHKNPRRKTLGLPPAGR